MYPLSNNDIYGKQFGFQKYNSVSHEINFSVNKIIDKIKIRNLVLGIFFDISKAFDTIYQSKLVVKLENYGIRNTTLKLLTNYLSNRLQIANYKEADSGMRKIEFGVSQVSGSGPCSF